MARVWRVRRFPPSIPGTTDVGMNFKGTILIDGEHEAIEFEIEDARPSTSAAFECKVSTTYPRTIRTKVFGVDAKNAQDSAVRFLSQLIGDRPLFSSDGTRVEFLPKARSHSEVTSTAGNLGLAVSIVAGEGDKVRLLIEDIERLDSGWVPRSLYTYRDHDGHRVVEMTLSEKEYADIGVSIMARLAAHMKLGG
jgi:hypothetical protein